MRHFITLLMTLLVVNPFCACGAVRGDAHASEVLVETECGHDHCGHDAPADQEPCGCDFHSDFLSTPGSNLSITQPAFFVINDLCDSPDFRLPEERESGLPGMIRDKGEESPPAPPVWQRLCVRLL